MLSWFQIKKRPGFPFTYSEHKFVSRVHTDVMTHVIYLNIAGSMAATMFSRGGGGEQRATTEGRRYHPIPEVSPHSGAPPAVY